MAEIEQTATVEQKKRSLITIVTSVAPRNIEKQRLAIKSWIDLGFHVVSINTAQEVEIISVQMPEIEFHVVQSDGASLFGKPFIFLNDVFDYFRKSDTPVCGIVNSDIHLKTDPGFLDFLHAETRESLIFGSRVETKSPGSTEGSIYKLGFDYFFFDRSILSIFPDEIFCLGMPWCVQDRFIPKLMLIAPPIRLTI
jgi:hypothetical protein